MEDLQRIGALRSDDFFLYKLQNLRQISDVQTYQRYFEMLQNLVIGRYPDLDDSFFVSCCINGLKEEIRNVVQLFRPVTVSDVLSLAEFKESILAVESKMNASNQPVTVSAIQATLPDAATVAVDTFLGCKGIGGHSNGDVEKSSVRSIVSVVGSTTRDRDDKEENEILDVTKITECVKPVEDGMSPANSFDSELAEVSKEVFELHASRGVHKSLEGNYNNPFNYVLGLGGPKMKFDEEEMDSPWDSNTHLQLGFPPSLMLPAEVGAMNEKNEAQEYLITLQGKHIKVFASFDVSEEIDVPIAWFPQSTKDVCNSYDDLIDYSWTTAAAIPYMTTVKPPIRNTQGAVQSNDLNDSSLRVQYTGGYLLLHGSAQSLSHILSKEHLIYDKGGTKFSRTPRHLHIHNVLDIVDQETHVLNMVDSVDAVNYLVIPEVTNPFSLVPSMLQSSSIHWDSVCASLNCCSFHCKDGKGCEAPQQEVSIKVSAQFSCITSHNSPAKTHLIFQPEWRPGIIFLNMNISRARAIDRLCDCVYSISNYSITDLSSAKNHCVIDILEYSSYCMIYVGIFDPGITSMSPNAVRKSDLVIGTGNLLESSRSCPQVIRWSPSATLIRDGASAYVIFLEQFLYSLQVQTSLGCKVVPLLANHVEERCAAHPPFKDIPGFPNQSAVFIQVHWMTLIVQTMRQFCIGMLMSNVSCYSGIIYKSYTILDLSEHIVCTRFWFEVNMCVSIRNSHVVGVASSRKFLRSSMQPSLDLLHFVCNDAWWISRRQCVYQYLSLTIGFPSGFVQYLVVSTCLVLPLYVYSMAIIGLEKKFNSQVSVTPRPSYNLLLEWMNKSSGLLARVRCLSGYDSNIGQFVNFCEYVGLFVMLIINMESRYGYEKHKFTGLSISIKCGMLRSLTHRQSQAVTDFPLLHLWRTLNAQVVSLTLSCSSNTTVACVFLRVNTVQSFKQLQVNFCMRPESVIAAVCLPSYSRILHVVGHAHYIFMTSMGQANKFVFTGACLIHRSRCLRPFPSKPPCRGKALCLVDYILAFPWFKAITETPHSSRQFNPASTYLERPIQINRAPTPFAIHVCVSHSITFLWMIAWIMDAIEWSHCTHLHFDWGDMHDSKPTVLSDIFSSITFSRVYLSTVSDFATGGVLTRFVSSSCLRFFSQDPSPTHHFHSLLSARKKVSVQNQPENPNQKLNTITMATIIAARFVSRRFSSGGKIFCEEEKAAENIHIKKIEKERLEKLGHQGAKATEPSSTTASASGAEASGATGAQASGETPSAAGGASTDKSRNYNVIAGVLAVAGAAGWFIRSAPESVEEHSLIGRINEQSGMFSSTRVNQSGMFFYTHVNQPVNLKMDRQHALKYSLVQSLQYRLAGQLFIIEHAGWKQRVGFMLKISGQHHLLL